MAGLPARRVHGLVVIGIEDALQQCRQAACLGCGERAGHGRQGLRDLCGAAFGEFGPARAEEHVYAAPVEGVGRSVEQASFFGAVDETGDAAMVAVVTGRADRSKPLTWIEIGSIAGPTARIPSAALRAARLTIVGSGQGSVGAREYLAELPALAEAITAGRLDIDARAMPLADVEQAWTATGATHRIVLTPQP